jgi:hypothetical protein
VNTVPGLGEDRELKRRLLKSSRLLLLLLLYPGKEACRGAKTELSSGICEDAKDVTKQERNLGHTYGARQVYVAICNNIDK